MIHEVTKSPVSRLAGLVTIYTGHSGVAHQTFLRVGIMMEEIDRLSKAWMFHQNEIYN